MENVGRHEITSQQLIVILAALEIAAATIEELADGPTAELADIEDAREIVIDLLFGDLPEE